MHSDYPVTKFDHQNLIQMTQTQNFHLNSQNIYTHM
jgi:hypothetical protein